MLIKLKELKLYVLMLPFIGSFSVIGIAATQSDESSEQKAGNAGSSGRPEVTVNLFPDAVYEVSNKEIETTEENSLIWSGDTTGRLHGGWVWFAFLPNGTAVGNFWAGSRSFQISPLREFPGLSVIYEIDPSSQPQPRVPEEVESGAAPENATVE